MHSLLESAEGSCQAIKRAESAERQFLRAFSKVPHSAAHTYPGAWGSVITIIEFQVGYYGMCCVLSSEL